MTRYNKDQEKDKTNEINGKNQVENAHQRSNLSKCFQCDQTSHLSNACSKRKTVAILEEDEDYVEKQEEDLSQEEEVLEPDMERQIVKKNKK